LQQQQQLAALAAGRCTASCAAAVQLLTLLLPSVSDMCRLPVAVVSNERLSEPEAVCKSSSSNNTFLTKTKTATQQPALAASQAFCFSAQFHIPGYYAAVLLALQTGHCMLLKSVAVVLLRLCRCSP
jgi:hypothetical protein